MDSPSYIPETLPPSLFKDPQFLMYGLRGAIAHADMWWAKQFFGHIIRNKHQAYFIEIMPYVIASTCYYQLYTMMHTIQKQRSPAAWWSCIEELVRSVKTLDVTALSIQQLPALMGSVAKDNYIASITKSFVTYYSDLELLPETINVVGRYPITVKQIKCMRAVEYLMQNRRTPFVRLLDESLIITEPSRLPYKYIFREDAIIRLSRFSHILFGDLYVMSAIVDLLITYGASHTSVSIQPTEADPPTVHTNNFIYQFLLESLLSYIGLTLDNIMELCDTDISCEFLGVYDA